MANDWVPLNFNISQRSQIIEDTVEPSLPAREINLKACAPEIRTQNLPVDLGIKPRLFRQTVPVGAHCVSANWATEVGREEYYCCWNFPTNWSSEFGQDNGLIRNTGAHCKTEIRPQIFIGGLGIFTISTTLNYILTPVRHWTLEVTLIAWTVREWGSNPQLVTCV